MARQFDVFRHPVQKARATYPFIVVLQHDGVPVRQVVVVAPLGMPQSFPISRLQPRVEVLGGTYVLLTPEIGTITRRHLRRPVAQLLASRYQIIAAIDLLFTGS